MSQQLNKRQEQLKERFIAERGYWSEELWGQVLIADVDFFEACLNFSAAPWKNGVLPPKMKELIYIAIDAATTHLYVPGLRQHIKNAFKYGATKEEIMEVFELVSAMGMHSIIVGMPVLIEELEKAAD
ncbi:carboxymuconolactone decarboxylase family protein [Chloroflexota bacterium]